MKKEYRNVARTKRMIKNAFTELLSEKKSMTDITATELAARADISKSTFYNHYDSIYQVAEEFENELILKLSNALDDIEAKSSTDYDTYIRNIIEFLKQNEETYKKAISSPDVRLFIDKLKFIISKKISQDNSSLPFSQNKTEKYVQIRFLTNALVDTLADYFRGTLDVTLDELGEILIDLLYRLEK